LIQLATSIGQFQGLIIYFLDEHFDGYEHVRPEPIFFWLHMIVMNSPWAIVPGYLIYQSWNELWRASSSAGAAKVLKAE
jgi:cholestenol delta-isomerase